MKVRGSKEIDEFQGEQVTGWHQSGKSNKEIARFFQVNQQTVNDIANEFNEEGYYFVEQRSRRQSIVSEQTKRALKKKSSETVVSASKMWPTAWTCHHMW